jgi:hypothetical protein
LKKAHRREINRHFSGRHDWEIFRLSDVCKSQAIPNNDIIVIDVFIFLGIFEQIVFVVVGSLVRIFSCGVKLLRMILRDPEVPLNEGRLRSEAKFRNRRNRVASRLNFVTGIVPDRRFGLSFSMGKPSLS